MNEWKLDRGRPPTWDPQTDCKVYKKEKIMQIPQVFIDLLDSNSYLFRISWRAISSLASLTRRLSWVWLWADTARNSVWQRSSSFLISSSNFCKNKYGYYRIKMRNPVFIVTLCTLYIVHFTMSNDKKIL